MKKLFKALKLLSKFAAIPIYNKCKKCGDADPYLDDDGFCYKHSKPAAPKSQNNSPFPYVKLGNYLVSLTPPYHSVFESGIASNTFYHELIAEDIENGNIPNANGRIFDALTKSFPNADKNFLKNISSSLIEDYKKNKHFVLITDHLYKMLEKKAAHLNANVINNDISLYLIHNNGSPKSLLCTISLSPKKTKTDLHTLIKALDSGAFDFAISGNSPKVAVLQEIKRAILNA